MALVFAMLLWQALERQQLELQANAIDQARLQLHAQQQAVLGERQPPAPSSADSQVETGQQQQQLGVELLAQQLKQSQQELRTALAAAAEAQQEARQLRRELARYEDHCGHCHGSMLSTNRAAALFEDENACVCAAEQCCLLPRRYPQAAARAELSIVIITVCQGGWQAAA